MKDESVTVKSQTVSGQLLLHPSSFLLHPSEAEAVRVERTGASSPAA